MNENHCSKCGTTWPLKYRHCPECGMPLPALTGEPGEVQSLVRSQSAFSGGRIALGIVTFVFVLGGIAWLWLAAVREVTAWIGVPVGGMLLLHGVILFSLGSAVFDGVDCLLAGLDTRTIRKDPPV